MEQSRTQFSGGDDRESINSYHSLSFSAILALLFGIGSMAAMIHPATWVVPLIAIGFGAFALRQVRRSTGMGGAIPAWIGISLALFFLTWASSSYYFDRWVIYAEAQQISERWLNLVIAGEDMIAHQAMLHPATRSSSGMSVDDYYAKDVKAVADKEDAFGSPPASSILNVGKDAQIRHLRNVMQGVQIPGSNSQLIRQVYRVTPTGKPPIDAMLTLTREYRKDLGRATWIVADCLKPDDLP